MDNRLRASVIVLKPNDLRIGEKFLELEDILYFSTAPAVDTLIIVSHHTDMIRLTDQLLQQTHLQPIGILKLIHRDPRPAFPANFTDIWKFTQQSFCK